MNKFNKRSNYIFKTPADVCRKQILSVLLQFLQVTIEAYFGFYIQLNLLVLLKWHLISKSQITGHP